MTADDSGLNDAERQVSALECAVLERLAADHPNLRITPSALRVKAREFTGVGCFTTFEPDAAAISSVTPVLTLDALVGVPGVLQGLSAVLFCRPGEEPMLELFAYGGERWDGRHEGFTLLPAR